MVFSQVIAVFRGLLDTIGLPTNLLVIVTIVLERRFHVMRYVLLASLAVSDFLFLVLANSFLIASTAQEKWLYAQTMCHLNPFFVLYFYLNTVLHLIAISYERYSAIVKSPMTYDGTITKNRRVVLMIFIWVAPIPLSILPFVGWGQYVYNPEVFSCEQQAVHPENAARNIIVFTVLTLVVPSLIIVFLNWSVFRTVQTLQHNEVQVGNFDGSDMSESQLQEMSRRMSERKAVVDVCIIIAAFVVCYLPAWIVGICRQLKNLHVPAKLVLGANAVFHASTLCNPIIYSIRKRDFRAEVKNVLGRIGVLYGSVNDTDNNQIDMNNITVAARIGKEACTAPEPAQDSSPTEPQSTHNKQFGRNDITVRVNVGTGESTARPAAQAAQYQDERFYGSTGRAKVCLQSSRLSPVQEIIE